jgi:hypothetical protein
MDLINPEKCAEVGRYNRKKEDEISLVRKNSNKPLFSRGGGDNK